jgi:thioredoxin-related protein
MLRLALAFAIALSAPAAGAASLNDDGLHVQPWFVETFLDLKQDIDDAAQAGKRLVVFIEQKGCIYCTEMHEKALADPKIAEPIKAHFIVLQLNLFGEREVTDTDGKVLREKDAARRWGTVGTPTLLFLPKTSAEAAGKTAREAAVARMPGYLRPPAFQAMFRYVRDEAYLKGSFEKYLADTAATTN